jgi:hypothetical protein
MNKNLKPFLVGLAAGCLVMFFALGFMQQQREAILQAKVWELQGHLAEQQSGVKQADFDKVAQIAKDATAGLQACNDKFNVSTVIFEQSPIAALPLLHGSANLSIGSLAKPAWVIPAQVAVYTNQPGASYQWIDNRTHEIRGTFQALPPTQ